jgi:hypothetical protein
MMTKRLQGKLGWLALGLLIGSLFSGVAVARIIIPPNSVGAKSLTKGLRKKIYQAAAAVGPQGVKGDPGPRGASGETPASPSDQSFPIPLIRTLAVSDVAGGSAILEADIGPDQTVDGIYYQFQIGTDPDELRPEVSCPENVSQLFIQCFGAFPNGGSSDFHRQPGDLPTRALLPSDGEQHVRLEVDGLDPNQRYYYRLLAVERQQHVDTIQWIGSPVASPSQTFSTTDFDAPRAYGLISPMADEMELSRSSNARLRRPPDEVGIWCLETPGIDPARLLVQVSPADEQHVTVGGTEIPVVRWHVYPDVCDSREVEIETAIFDTLEGDYSRTSSLPFTFVIEEGGR